MAKHHSITKTVYWHGVFWTGTAEDLIAAGLCTADQLPEKASKTIRYKEFRIQRKSKRIFVLYLSNDEIMARADAGYRRFLARTLQPVPIDG